MSSKEELSQPSEKKRIAQVVSEFSSSTSNFYQRTSDHSTGETKVRENDQPSTGYSRTVISSQTCDNDDSLSMKKREDEMSPAERVRKSKPGYDASEL